MTKKYFSYDPNGDGFVLHDTAEAARAEAAAGLDAARLNAMTNGWGEEDEDICWGEIHQAATRVDEQYRPDDLDEDGCDADGDYWGDPDVDVKFDLQLRDIPKPTAIGDDLDPAIHV